MTADLTDVARVEGALAEAERINDAYDRARHPVDSFGPESTDFLEHFVDRDFVVRQIAAARGVLARHRKRHDDCPEDDCSCICGMGWPGCPEVAALVAAWCQS